MVVSAANASLTIEGSETIMIGSRFESQVISTTCSSIGRAEIISGKLPFGLRLTKNGNIVGYPTAVQETQVEIMVEGDGCDKDISEIDFVVRDEKFRLIYKELPTLKTGDKYKIVIEGQGGAGSLSGCSISRAETFYAGAAKPGGKTPAYDGVPDWLTISEDCVISAQPEKEEVVLMIITATNSEGSSASEFYALRSADDPNSMGWMEDKARKYNIDYQERFSPTGLTHERNFDGSYHGYGDAAIWTGTYLGGAVYYYAVTGEEYARKNVDKALEATTILREITGVPGLIARSYENDEWVGKSDEPYINVDPENHKYLVEEGPYKGWRYLTTASRDQYTGVFWGNGIIIELLDDPDFRNRASENIVSMASHLWDNKMHIMDRDGKHTRHGVMSGYGIQDGDGVKSYDPYVIPARIPNGMNAAMLLNWFDMAAVSAMDEETRKMWRERYENLIKKEDNPEPGREFENNYISTLKKVYIYGEAYNEYWETVWFNLNLFFNNYYHLIRFEENEKLRNVFRRTLTYFWDDKKEMSDGCEFPEKRRAGRERNPHFTWQYLAAQGDRDPDKIFNAVSELMAFPYGPRQRFNIVDPIEIKSVPGHEKWACEPIPVQYRSTSDFQWQRSPYAIKATWPANMEGRMFPGVDMITPYWMGRYFGFIPGNI